LRVVVAASVTALLIVAVVRAAAVVDSSYRGRGETICRLLWEYDAKTFLIRQAFPIVHLDRCVKGHGKLFWDIVTTGKNVAQRLSKMLVSLGELWGNVNV